MAWHAAVRKVIDGPGVVAYSLADSHGQGVRCAASCSSGLPEQVVEFFDGWFECCLGVGPLVEGDERSDEVAAGPSRG